MASKKFKAEVEFELGPTDFPFINEKHFEVAVLNRFDGTAIHITSITITQVPEGQS